MDYKIFYEVGDIIHTKFTSGIVRNKYEDTDKYGQMITVYEIELADGTYIVLTERDLKNI